MTGTAVELYGRCPVCRQRSWSQCSGRACQLMGVMAGYYAALRGSLDRLLSWPNPAFVFHQGYPYQFKD